MATMYVTEPGARIEKEYKRILVTKHDEVLKVTPLARLSEVVLVGHVGATTPALLALLNAGVGLTLITRSGRLRGRLVPPMPKNIPARQAQYAAASDPAFCLQVSRGFVSGKLRNARAMAYRIARRLAVPPSDELERLELSIKAIRGARDIPTLMGLEGAGSRAYFAVWRQAFTGELRFERRTRRPPRDPINALLSLGYSLLTQNLMTACEVVGLDPYDGFFHADKHGRPALALDLMEEFRHVVVDSVVQTMVNKRIVDGDDFGPGPGGGIYLNQCGLKRFFAQYSQRLNTQVTHPYHRRRLTYQQCFEVQARLLRKVIEGELDEYPPFRVR
jgi:CRISPR-associated protein Cas1